MAEAKSRLVNLFSLLTSGLALITLEFEALAPTSDYSALTNTDLTGGGLLGD
jgi:hypothetical protein